jgi:hypothetical protein
LQNTDLTYTIRFQNTGNDTAFTVRLVNQLPAELEEATLRMGTASHPFTWHLAANGALEFLFTHILLPDSTTNEPNSHGFVTYNIKTKPNLAAATTINNQAAIYFDVNAPVMTNVYTHTIATQLRDLFLTTTYNQPSKPILLRIFPNPTATNLTVQVEDVEKWYEVKILNILGQMVATQIIKSKNSVLNTENLPSGTYYIHISNEKSQTIAKFVKL